MKFLILLVTMFFALSANAMKEGVALRYPVGIPLALDTSTTNITNAAWVQFSASMPYACSGLLVHNSGAQPIKVGKGAAASEVDLGLVLPIGVSIIVPVETAKGVRLSLRSMGSTQSSGIITASCFQ